MNKRLEDAQISNLTYSIQEINRTLSETIQDIQVKCEERLSSLERKQVADSDALNKRDDALEDKMSDHTWMIEDLQNSSRANYLTLKGMSDSLQVTQDTVMKLEDEQMGLDMTLQQQNETLEVLKARLDLDGTMDEESALKLRSLQNQLLQTQSQLSSLNSTIADLKKQTEAHRGRLDGHSQDLIDASAAHNESLQQLKTELVDSMNLLSSKLTSLYSDVKNSSVTVVDLVQRLNGSIKQLQLADQSLHDRADDMTEKMVAITEIGDARYQEVMLRFANLTREADTARSVNDAELDTLRANLTRLKARFDNCSCDSAPSPKKKACDDEPCFPGVDCFDLRTPVDMKLYRCGGCPVGMYGNGETCDVYKVGARCNCYPDPHFITFDSLAHDFQGKCEYTLSKDCVNNDFRVHLQTDDSRGLSYTWPEAVAITVPRNNYVIRLWGNGTISVNNIDIISLPYVLRKDSSTISRSHGVITVRLGWSGAVVR